MVGKRGEECVMLQNNKKKKKQSDYVDDNAGVKYHYITCAMSSFDVKKRL